MAVSEEETRSAGSRLLTVAALEAKERQEEQVEGACNRR